MNQLEILSSDELEQLLGDPQYGHYRVMSGHIDDIYELTDMPTTLNMINLLNNYYPKKWSEEKLKIASDFKDIAECLKDKNAVNYIIETLKKDYPMGHFQPQRSAPPIITSISEELKDGNSVIKAIELIKSYGNKTHCKSLERSLTKISKDIEDKEIFLGAIDLVNGFGNEILPSQKYTPKEIWALLEKNGQERTNYLMDKRDTGIGPDLLSELSLFIGDVKDKDIIFDYFDFLKDKESSTVAALARELRIQTSFEEDKNAIYEYMPILEQEGEAIVKVRTMILENIEDFEFRKSLIEGYNQNIVKAYGEGVLKEYLEHVRMTFNDHVNQLYDPKSGLNLELGEILL